MLETIWFFLWVLLWAVYLILDGFDFGMGTLMPFVAKNNRERRIIYNAAGPYWDGNEVWLITAGGVTFAAFPKAYAVMFSALYAPLLLLLFALIFRAVAFEFRSKIEDSRWKQTWDIVLVLGNFLPALLLGVFFSNLFLGIPIDADGVYHGNLLKLLNPFGLLGGLLFVCIFAVHGGLWLALKSTGEIHTRAINASTYTWYATLVLVVTYLGLSMQYTPIWANTGERPYLSIFLFLALICFFGIRILLKEEKLLPAFLSSAGFILFCVFFTMFGMYPNLLTSNIDPSASLTVFNAASSTLTLKLMLGAVICVLPVVIAYQIWAFYTFRNPVTDEDLDSDHSY